MEGGTANNTVASSGAVIALYGGSLKSGEGNGPAKLSNAEVHSGAMIKVLGDGGVLNGTVNLGGLINTTTKRYEWIEVEVEEEDPDNPGQTIKYTD